MQDNQLEVYKEERKYENWTNATMVKGGGREEYRTYKYLKNKEKYR